MLPALLPKLAKAYPHLDLQIVEDKTETLVQAVRDGQLDLTLAAMPLHHADLVEQILFDDPFHLVAAKNHPIWNQKKPSAQDIADGPLLLLDEGHCLRDQALSLCRVPRANTTAGASFRAASLATLLELVANGMGVTLLPEIALAREAASNKKLRAQKLHLPGAARSIGLLYRPRHTQAADYKKLAALIKG